MKTLITFALSLWMALSLAANPLVFLSGAGSVSGVVSDSPGKTGLVAWYDFADLTDADGNTYPLSPFGTSPAHTAGPPSYMSTTDGAPGAFVQSTTLDDNFGYNGTSDWSYVIRVRPQSPTGNGDLLFTMNGARTMVEYNTGVNGLRAALGSTSPANSGVTPSAGNWYTIVVVRDGTLGHTSISVNGGAFVTNTGATGSNAVGTGSFGATTTSNSNAADYDFAGFWAGRKLTLSEAQWLHNSNGTRTYSEL